MKIFIYLQKVVCTVILGNPNRTASISEMAEEISGRNLLIRPSDGMPPPDYQIKIRTTMANGQYFKLFEKVGKDSVRLRNCDFNI